MKALTLWEPWASAMATGAKRFETRGWKTEYRGDLVICAAKQRVSPVDLSFELLRWLRDNRNLFPGHPDSVEDLLQGLPFGKAVCVVRLYGCLTTEKIDEGQIGLGVVEALLGNYGPKRYAWMTDSLRVLKEPTPVKGKQSLFDLTTEEQAKLRAQL